MKPEGTAKVAGHPTTAVVSQSATTASEPGAQPDYPRRSAARVVLGWLSFRNISAIYLFAAMFVVFTIWVPTTFLEGATWRSLLTDQAESGMLAIALVIPLAAGVVDLAIGSELGLGAIIVAWLIMNHNVPIVPAILITLVVGVAVGLFNGWLVVKVKIDAFIATIAMQFVLLAVIDWICDSQQIINLPNSFNDIATNEIFGVGLPVYMLIVLAFIVWYVLERTPLGRRVYATGGNIDSARLAGVRVNWVIVGSLVFCALIAAFSGVLESADLGTGDPTIGPNYLLPAISAAFLGATQFKGGRVNVWGAVLATYVLAVGVKGLQLAGAPIWIPDMFDGLALLVAVGMAKYETSARSTQTIRRLLRLARPDSVIDMIPADQRKGEAG